MADLSLPEIVRDFAAGLTAADARRPVAMSQRGTRTYQAGIGPHSENVAVALALSELRLRRPGIYDVAAPIPYPGSRLKCDLGIGHPTQRAIEMKMARAFGDNGKLDDTYVKDILSPYASDHSALMDIEKLRASGFDCRKAILVYGYDYPGRPPGSPAGGFGEARRAQQSRATRERARGAGSPGAPHRSRDRLGGDVSDPQVRRRGGQTWSEWCSLEDATAPRVARAPRVAGIYRVRCRGEEGLVYIGQSGRSLRTRLRQLRDGMQLAAAAAQRAALRCGMRLPACCPRLRNRGLLDRDG